MGKKKEGPKEIPIQFVDKSEIEPATSDSMERKVVTTSEAGQSVETGGTGAESAPSAAQSGGAQGGEGEGKESEGESKESKESKEGKELTIPALLSDIAELTQALSDARDQTDALIREKSTLYDQMLRRQAEFENNRRRLDKERGDFYQRTRAELLLELLPVLDNFDRALMSLETSDGDASALRHGVELIHKQLKDALAKLGLQPLEAVGKTFDPNVHEAVTVEPSDEHTENTVIEELERGYKLGDRLLRPAKVRVAANPRR